MKKLTLILILTWCFCTELEAQVKDTIKAWSVNDKISINPFTAGMAYDGLKIKNDTIQCYFLKIPAVIEFPLQAIGAQWYLGYSVGNSYDWKVNYLYLDKSPVKEQVLMSIPKAK